MCGESFRVIRTDVRRPLFELIRSATVAIQEPLLVLVVRRLGGNADDPASEPPQQVRQLADGSPSCAALGLFAACVQRL